MTEQQHHAESREDRMVVIERDADGKPTVWCDPEIVDLVRALNAGGVRTVASCSGHGHRPGSIALADGRWLILPRDEADRAAIEDVFPIDINGDRRARPAAPEGEWGPLSLMKAMKIAEAGYQRWAAKPHNVRWVRKIDGTPIRNDLVVNMAEEFRAALAAAPKPEPASAAQVTVEQVLDAYEAETDKLPLGHEDRTRGASSYNWRRAVVADIRALTAALSQQPAPQPDAKASGVEGWRPVVHLLSTMQPGDQMDVLFGRPNWSWPILGMVSHMGDRLSWSAYDQQNDKFIEWEAEPPTIFCPRPELPSTDDPTPPTEAGVEPLIRLSDHNTIVERLKAGRDEARELVAEANNSLYGSQGYFHSSNGGSFDKYHLARPIEKLKGYARALTTECERSARLREALKNLRNNPPDVWTGPGPRAGYDIGWTAGLDAALRELKEGE